MWTIPENKARLCPLFEFLHTAKIVYEIVIHFIHKNKSIVLNKNIV